MHEALQAKISFVFVFTMPVYVKSYISSHTEHAQVMMLIYLSDI